MAPGANRYIDVSRVSKTFEREGTAVDAVAEVDLRVGEREFVSIVGPSGCGKSTLLMMMAGLEEPSAGGIFIDKKLVTAPRSDIGLIFQDATLLPWKSALENVLFPIKILRLSREEYTPRAIALLESVGLGEFLEKRPFELSGGMRQRVAICRALIHEPKLLLMDEPFSALDAITRDEMGQLLCDLWDRHRKTGVFVTHSVREAAYLSDRVVVMKKRPATVIADIRIPFPRPRHPSIMESAEFNRLCGRLREWIEYSTGRTEMRPDV